MTRLTVYCAIHQWLTCDHWWIATTPLLKPPPSKSDNFGEVWGNNPIVLPLRSGDPRNAAERLRRLEMAYPCPDSERQATPLFTMDGINPFTSSRLDTLWEHMCKAIPHAMPAAERANYSWHSFRVTLASALLAAKIPAPQIQAICRWQCEASLAIYARLTRWTTLTTWTKRQGLMALPFYGRTCQPSTLLLK